MTDTIPLQMARNLQTLLRAIASRDQRTTVRLLAETPPLARLALRVGTSRDDEHTYYSEEIAHYAYAGDTPLHIAAAAYQADTAEELVSRGANVSAETGVAPNRSTTRPMGLRSRLGGTWTRNRPSWSS